MNAYILTQLLEEMATAEHMEKYEKLDLDERLLLYCYQKLDTRDRRDILCFLSEKVSR